MKSYRKSLVRMFKTNIIRLAAIALIIAVGICIVTGLSAVPAQMRESLAIANLLPEEIAMAQELANKIDLISAIFPIFFVAVAALTVLTTMTRLVEEERPTAACFKTLGYSNGAIIMRYLIFAGVCMITGCALGVVLGNYVVLPVIFNAVKDTVRIPDPGSAFYLSNGLIWSAVMSVAVLLTALSVSLQKCRAKPAELLRPKSPKAGKKIFLEKIPFFWKPLKFKYKSTTRNIIRYKGKLIMTLLSVGGSSLLVFCGIGLFSALRETTDTDIAGALNSINLVAATICICAVLLAVLVLFSLTNVNIEERRREISTLKVLGYNKMEVAGFIFREVMIISIIGVLISLPIAYYVLGAIFNFLDFGSLAAVEWYVWILTLAVMMLSIVFTDILLYRKIDKIDMISSLKAVE